MKVLNGNGRFYIRTKSGNAELLYRMYRKVMVVYHVFVPSEEREKGVAGILATHAFQLAKKKGLKVRPDCPYIVHFLKMHKELKRYEA